MKQIPAAGHQGRRPRRGGQLRVALASRLNFGAKPIAAYAESLTTAGLVIVGNYQYGKPGGTAPSDYTRGYAGGVADAPDRLADPQRQAFRQSAPIFFTIDEDISRDTWNTVALQ